MSKESKKYLREITNHKNWDGIIHYGNHGEKNIDINLVLDGFHEDQLKKLPNKNKLKY